jgi:hypothetical protein
MQSNVQIQNPYAMSIADAASIIEVAIKNNRPILLQSMPGLAKTQVTKGIVKKLGFDIYIEFAGTSEPSDIRGFAFPNEERTKATFLPFGVLELMINAKKPLVIFLDDIHMAVGPVQNAWAQVLEERRINGMTISPHVRFVAACNRKQDNAGANTLTTMFLSRFKTILEIKPDAPAWISWASANNMPPVLITYIKCKPDMISTFNPQVVKTNSNFACYRTLEALGNWINDGVTNIAAWAGCVGEGFATDFGGFYDLYTQIGNLPINITKGIAPTAQQQDLINNKSDVRFMVCAALAQLANNKNIANIGTFVATLAPEYQNFFYTDAAARDVSIRSTKQYIDFAVANQGTL